MMKTAKMVFFIFPAFLFGTTIGSADNTQKTYTTEQARADYRLFLQKLKELNGEYKQVTGQIAKVMKEEGTPTWDMGNTQTAQGIAIKESREKVIVTMDLPGIKKDTIKIAVQDGNKLTVSAERKTLTDTQKVEKRVDLPSAVDPAKAQAGYEDGVLTITLDKILSQEVAISVK